MMKGINSVGIKNTYKNFINNIKEIKTFFLKNKKNIGVKKIREL